MTTDEKANLVNCAVCGITFRPSIDSRIKIRAVPDGGLFTLDDVEAMNETELAAFGVEIPHGRARMVTMEICGECRNAL